MPIAQSNAILLHGARRFRRLGGETNDKDTERASRAMKAMLSMTKLDIAALKRAHEGG